MRLRSGAPRLLHRRDQPIRWVLPLEDRDYRRRVEHHRRSSPAARACVLTRCPPYFLHIGGNMATLNIKNFPSALYQKLRERARRQHRSMAQEVTYILERVLEEEEALSILELDGLGREIWEGVDAAEHVDDERRSWD
jgi:plasmid stability protein